MDMSQPDHLDPLLDALDSLQHLLERFDNRGVIIGGAAVSILGRARFTEDVDAVFLLAFIKADSCRHDDFGSVTECDDAQHILRTQTTHQLNSSGFQCIHFLALHGS